MNGAIPVATNKENPSWPWNNKPRFVLKITWTSNSGARALGVGVQSETAPFYRIRFSLSRDFLITLFKLVGWLFIRRGREI
jgi:hypothetical protein